MMDAFLKTVFRLSKGANILAGITLTLIMGITVTDVILRSWGRPIVGIFELVSFFGAVVIGFSIPFTSWMRGHIFVDFLAAKLPPGVRGGVHLGTRCMGLGLFLLIGWNLIKMGNDLSRSGEVLPTLQMPFYPIVYAVGAACFVECLVLFGDILKVFRGRYE
jgi:TRAP-type C4-dicarboxylate transport system permease small subunit